MVEEFGDEWADFGMHMGPFGFGFWGPRRRVSYSRTGNSHILRLRLDPKAEKDQIKVRLVEPGVLEIEWPRRPKGEEIPIE
ncbi:MAG: hypothetical protein ACYS76_04045 [Planctomycetota bacterium]